MKKVPMFHTGGIAKYYAVIGDKFYYWSSFYKGWVESMNRPGMNEKRLEKALREGKVYLATIKGGVL